LLAPSTVAASRQSEGKDLSPAAQIILTQGLNRQIRRMCESLGFKVLRLRRIRIVNITLGKLKTGEYRKLSTTELDTLDSLIGE